MTSPTDGTAHADGADEAHDDIIYPATLPFVLVHLAAFGALWSGVTTGALVSCLALYVVRMFGVTAGYHRFFSHRSFKTSRVGQLALAWVAQSSAQRGAIWWAAKHRHHHRHSDTEHDVHSPRHSGFLHSHVGWIFTPRHEETDFEAVPDLTRYPELMLLERYPHLPAAVLAIGCLLLGGWPGLVVGFFWSTVLLYHGTFFINSLAHVVGRQRYVTGDDSRNNWWLALITLGEGWHNNHHFYMSSTRQGFRWYEIDPTYYALKAMSWVGLVWELREPPAAVLAGEQPLGRRTVEKVAAELAASFPVRAIAEQVQAAWAGVHPVDDLRERARKLVADAEHALSEVEMPSLPGFDDLRRRALEMFAYTPSLDDIVQRARLMLARAVSLHLLEGMENGSPA
ncbi:MAG: fatty acid desaturase [Gemmatimonadetes bacterium]|nr:fatty acid desaturase [Gemmatimonadota bacterium]